MVDIDWTNDGADVYFTPPAFVEAGREGMNESVTLIDPDTGLFLQQIQVSQVRRTPGSQQGPVVSNWIYPATPAPPLPEDLGPDFVAPPVDGE